VTRISGKACHFSAQNVDELRQGVEAESVDDAADKGGFRFTVQVSACSMRGAAELQRPELATAWAHSLLPNQDRAAAVATYGDCHQDHQWQRHEEEEKAGQDDIAHSRSPIACFAQSSLPGYCRLPNLRHLTSGLRLGSISGSFK
jgi:hypothetical protein